MLTDDIERDGEDVSFKGEIRFEFEPFFPDFHKYILNQLLSIGFGL